MGKEEEAEWAQNVDEDTRCTRTSKRPRRHLFIFFLSKTGNDTHTERKNINAQTVGETCGRMWGRGSVKRGYMCYEVACGMWQAV